MTISNELLLDSYAIIERETSSLCRTYGLRKEQSQIDYARDCALDWLINLASVPADHPSPKGYLTLSIRGRLKNALGIKSKADNNNECPANSSVAHNSLLGNSKGRMGLVGTLKEDWEKELAKLIAAKRHLNNTKSSKLEWYHKNRWKVLEQQKAYRQAKKEQTQPALLQGDIVF